MCVIGRVKLGIRRSDWPRAEMPQNSCDWSPGSNPMANGRRVGTGHRPLFLLGMPGILDSMCSRSVPGSSSIRSLAVGECASRLLCDASYRAPLLHTSHLLAQEDNQQCLLTHRGPSAGRWRSPDYSDQTIRSPRPTGGEYPVPVPPAAPTRSNALEMSRNVSIARRRGVSAYTSCPGKIV